VITGSEIIMDDGCFDYENTIAATTKAAKKHRKAAKQVGKSTNAAQALRERARWVDADNLADYNTQMLNVSQVALDQVSNGRSAEVGPLDQYLFDTIAFCGLADSHAAAQQQMLEVNTLAEKIRALAESALPDTT
jgi:anion-transporting  ArsA/GET3 family ATPase